MKRETETHVLNALERYGITRQDDFILIYAVYKSINPKVKDMSFADVMRNHKELGLPSFESVTRCRRKIQETRQDLIDWKTAVVRADEREEFENYSKR